MEREGKTEKIYKIRKEIHFTRPARKELGNFLTIPVLDEVGKHIHRECFDKRLAKQ